MGSRNYDTDPMSCVTSTVKKKKIAASAKNYLPKRKNTVYNFCDTGFETSCLIFCLTNKDPAREVLFQALFPRPVYSDFVFAVFQFPGFRFNNNEKVRE